MGETTRIIKRRIRHIKTTVAGIATILGPILAAFFPEYAGKILIATSTLTGAGLLAAADGSHVDKLRDQGISAAGDVVDRLKR